MIMAGGKGERLHPLTRERSKPSVPFGGRYRIIDFVLSNLVNSGLFSMYVLVQYRSQSLIEHLRMAWRTTGILSDAFIAVVPPQMRTGEAWYRGTADAVLQNLHLIDDFNPDVVAVFGADHIYRMDISQMVAFHLESGAEVTMAARPVRLEQASAFGVLGVDRQNRVVDWAEKPAVPTRHAGRSHASPRVDGQLHLHPPSAGRRPAPRRPPQHRPRFRPLHHSRDRGHRQGVRLRLPGKRGARGEALRGAGLLARRGHHRELLGIAHGLPGRVAALRPGQPPVAHPGGCPPRPARPLHRRRRRQLAHRGGIAHQARHHSQLDPRPQRVGERGRAHRGLHRHGLHLGGQGRPTSGGPSSIATTSSRPIARSGAIPGRIA